MCTWQSCVPNNQTLWYMWPGLQKSTMWAQKYRRFSSFLYHNLVTVCTITIKSLSLLQKLMGFWNLWKLDTAFGAKDIAENITRCNLHSGGWFSQARPVTYHSDMWHSRQHSYMYVKLLSVFFIFYLYNCIC